MTAFRPMKITIRKKNSLTLGTLGPTPRFASFTLDKCNVNHFCHLPGFAGSLLNKW
jgi:hypothetical protein